ncbi:MAG: hypothetical protein FJY97_07720 [candidate division Zixibacteria bacterium]|nr:hypothetical protein [candidate division Zixibacteria bacterium]
MRVFILIGTGLIAATSLACGGSSSPYPFVFTPRYTFTESPDAREFPSLELNHDGRLNLAIYQKLESGPYALMLHEFLGTGSRVRGQFNRSFPFDLVGHPDIDRDRRDEIMIGFVKDDRLVIEAYGQTTRENRAPAPLISFASESVQDANGDGAVKIDRLPSTYS